MSSDILTIVRRLESISLRALSYGEKCNAEFLANYGFVPLNNTVPKGQVQPQTFLLLFTAEEKKATQLSLEIINANIV
jgi:hypothetical protein